MDIGNELTSLIRECDAVISTRSGDNNTDVREGVLVAETILIAYQYETSERTTSYYTLTDIIWYELCTLDIDLRGECEEGSREGARVHWSKQEVVLFVVEIDLPGERRNGGIEANAVDRQIRIIISFESIV